jgi:hypothetical protein
MTKNIKYNRKGGAIELPSPRAYAEKAVLNSVDPTGNLAKMKGHVDTFDPTKKLADLKGQALGQVDALKSKIPEMPKMPEVKLGEMPKMPEVKLGEMPKMPEVKLGEMQDKIGELAEDIFEKGLEKAEEGAAYVGKVISDPATQEKVGEAAKQGAEALAHIARVAEPGIQQLAIEGEKIAKTSAGPAFRAVGQMVKDGFEAIPGVALIAEAVDASTAGLAAAAIGFKSLTGLMKATNATIENTKNSVGEFKATNVPQIQTSKAAAAAGGGKLKSRRYNSKPKFRARTKKVQKRKNKTKKRVSWKL